jgi:hypothetical protein
MKRDPHSKPETITGENQKSMSSVLRHAARMSARMAPNLHWGISTHES